MKQRHVAAEALNARLILQACHIAIGQDFHTLSSEQIDQLLAEADRVRYQKPRNANGSRGRYYHDRLQRMAAR